MGLDFYKNYRVARAIFEEANEILEYKVSELCFYGPDTILSQTLYVQPAILVTSFVYLKMLQDMESIKPTFLAGHSLGEYTALLCAGVLPFSKVLRLVSKRAIFMEEASRTTPGGMLAVLGLSEEAVQKVCKEVNVICPNGFFQIANLNCPGQIVVSGAEDTLSVGEELLRKTGAKRVVRLQVSGPFHSVAMDGVREKISHLIQDIDFAQPSIPIISNFSGQEITDPDEMKKALVEQVNHPVLWEKGIRRMIAKGVDTFVEIGPGRVLSNIGKRISRDVRFLSFDTLDEMRGLGV
jgi:[acyl-carrier-protein] S-malonyltransferase